MCTQYRSISWNTLSRAIKKEHMRSWLSRIQITEVVFYKRKGLRLGFMWQRLLLIHVNVLPSLSVGIYLNRQKFSRMGRSTPLLQKSIIRKVLVNKIWTGSHKISIVCQMAMPSTICIFLIKKYYLLNTLKGLVIASKYYDSSANVCDRWMIINRTGYINETWQIYYWM